MLPNFSGLNACAFIPFILSFVWYNPNLFGFILKNNINFPKEYLNKKLKIFHYLLSFLLYVFISLGIFTVTVHQTNVLSLTGPDLDAFKTGTAAAFMKEYGDNFHSFQHGISHGIFLAFFTFSLPFIGLSAIRERKTFKFILIEGGFWIISLTIMAVIISRLGGISVV